MIDGTYNIEVDTPFGRKSGKVVLRSEGDTAIGEIDAPIVGKQHVEGRLEGDTFSTEGEFKIKLVGKVNYSLKGEVVGDDLRISIDSNKGSFELKGSRA